MEMTYELIFEGFVEMKAVLMYNLDYTYKNVLSGLCFMLWFWSTVLGQCVMKVCIWIFGNGFSD